MIATPQIAFRISPIEYAEGRVGSSKAVTDGSAGLWISLLNPFTTAIVTALVFPAAKMEAGVTICWGEGAIVGDETGRYIEECFLAAKG